MGARILLVEDDPVAALVQQSLGHGQAVDTASVPLFAGVQLAHLRWMRGEFDDLAIELRAFAGVSAARWLEPFADISIARPPVIVCASGAYYRGRLAAAMRRWAEEFSRPLPVSSEVDEAATEPPHPDRLPQGEGTRTSSALLDQVPSPCGRGSG